MTEQTEKAPRSLAADKLALVRKIIREADIDEAAHATLLLRVDVIDKMSGPEVRRLLDGCL